MAEHTATPYSVNYKGVLGYLLRGPNGREIGYLLPNEHGDGRQPGEGKATAEFVLTACNAHDQLVEQAASLKLAVTSMCNLNDQLVEALQGLLEAINSSHPDAADMVANAECAAKAALLAAGVTP